jgi:hypothetical protein
MYRLSSGNIRELARVQYPLGCFTVAFVSIITFFGVRLVSAENLSEVKFLAILMSILFAGYIGVVAFLLHRVPDHIWQRDGKDRIRVDEEAGKNLDKEWIDDHEKYFRKLARGIEKISNMLNSTSAEKSPETEDKNQNAGHTGEGPREIK